MKRPLIYFEAIYEFDPYKRRVPLNNEYSGEIIDLITLEKESYYLVKINKTPWIVSPKDICHFS